MTVPHKIPAAIQAALIAVCIGTQACTTMKAVEASGNEFEKGNVGAGLWNATMGIAMGAIVDVFTLGGTATPEEGVQAVSTVAQSRQNPSSTSTSAAAYSTAAYNYTSTDTTPATTSSDYTYTTARNAPTASSSPVANASPSPAAGSAASGASANADTGTKATPQYLPSAKKCASLDTRSSSHFAVNSCNQQIVIAWFDQGYCRTGCQAWPKGGSRESITPIKGTVDFAACYYPNGPRDPATLDQWNPKRDTNFVCVK